MGVCIQENVHGKIQVVIHKCKDLSKQEGKLGALVVKSFLSIAVLFQVWKGMVNGSQEERADVVLILVCAPFLTSSLILGLCTRPGWGIELCMLFFCYLLLPNGLAVEVTDRYVRARCHTKAS